jgi:hypothetical protein
MFLPRAADVYGTRRVMDELRHIVLSVVSAVGELATELAAEAIVYAILGAIMLAGVVPIYLVLKKITGSKTTFSQDLQESFTARPRHTPGTLKVLPTLDSVESIILKVYKYVLILAVILATAFMVWLFADPKRDYERNFMRLYLGIGYLFLLGWAAGSLAMIRKRRQERAGGKVPKSVPTTQRALAEFRMSPLQVATAVAVFLAGIALFTVMLMLSNA